MIPALPHCKGRAFAVALCLLLFWLPFAAQADRITTQKAEVHYANGNYLFSADFDVRLNFVVEQALEQGVPLYFISEFTLTHPRWYWFDETISQDVQTFRLSYNTLTRQYRITRGALSQNISSLSEALRLIGHLSVAPVRASSLAGGADGSYLAAVRLRLDVSRLPKPLQVNALAGDDWNLDSDWYRWVVRPGAI